MTLTSGEQGRPASNAALAVVGVVASLLFIAIGAFVRSRPPEGLDLAVQGWVLAHQGGVEHGIFHGITVLGGITAMRVVAVAAAATLLARRQWGTAARLVVVPLVAVPIFRALKAAYARPRPLGLGAGVESDGAYPSGHALTAAAVCAAIAYALWRGRVIRRGPALALALVPPILVGFSRIALNVHWTTDVVGGWCAGVVIATCFAAVHDRFTPSTNGRSRSERASAGTMSDVA